MYTLSPIRAIPDVNYVPIPIVPVINPVSERPTDLSFAGLRSVSPIHCEYLTNMGVTASMSVSIIRDGRLWGLIACHHFSPKFVPYETRKSCTFLGQVLSGEITRREVEEESDYNTRSTNIRAKFLELMATSPRMLLGLTDSSPNLLDFIDADGAAVVVDGTVKSLGLAPGYTDVMNLIASLRKVNAPSTFFTKSLRNHFASAESMRDTASGVIALEIARNPSQYILFFRPEMPQTVTWGGNPEKPVIPTDDGYRLSPRLSFAAWKETLYGVANPWSKGEIRAADELRKLVVMVLVKQHSAN
jgi:light-regulated signal transduction histidine kinase (bacteriophytochrome)